jgi:glucokinase
MSKKFAIGVDLGGTNLKAGLVDAKYRIRDRLSFCTPGLGGKHGLIAQICRAVDELRRRNKLSLSEIAGVGIGVPGPVDHKKGIIHFFPNIPGWRNVRLRDILQRNLKIPVSLDNDAKAAGLAEFFLGAGRGLHNVLCVTLGTGVGGALILGGRLFRGVDNAAGEIGHLPVNLRGPRCNCGGIACLEAYVGNSRIGAAAKKICGRDIPLEELSQLAARGNAKALRVWQETGFILGTALAGAVNLLNLDAVVIGGGVSNAGEILFSRVRQALRRRAMSVQARRIKIVAARLGGDAGIIGAAILAQEGTA